ncbi:MAG: zinc ABC transporter substrate-binding protein [Candidatus Magnetoovum sp. WYHC-5]|nr:zinc ABC transporter substrate-binding protein [Candidatus Magnetoovum sp. WYHC-5]
MSRRMITTLILVMVFIAIKIPIINSMPCALSQVKEVNATKLPVVASIYPIYFFSKAIGGGKAEVFNMTPSGVEPHDYEPTALDMARIEDSKLVILNGGGLEGWEKNVKKNIKSDHTLIVIAGEGLANQQMVEEGKNTIDPHIWLSPTLAQKMVDNIATGFIQVDHANADYYKTNASTLKAKIETLDVAYKTGLKNCKEKNIITSHAAFGYLAASYGLKQVSIAGLSPDNEPSPRQMVDIVKFAKANNVKYIFFESLVSPKLSQTIANEIGVQTMVLNPIEGLTAEEVAEGQDYFTIMMSNLTNIQIALRCRQ